MKKKILGLFLSFLTIASTLFSSLPVYADYMEEMEQRKLLPIQSNLIENWPEGPELGAGSAILMDADSGIILYEKNIHEKMYPASTTKLMTCLLAMEKKDSSLNDMVSFSYDAVFGVPRDGSNMGIDVGESMTLEDCLYGILVLSANEVSSAVGEYVSGDQESFVKLMNDRAKELGCLNTHFNNAHGYTDPDHYTSAYDLALIGREFFKNELLAKMSRTLLYHWYATDTQPDDIYLASKNYLLNGNYVYDGLVGSKTGFTDESRQVLVSCAERGGMRLICVIMQEETPYQYEDTISLFNYGFNNFDYVKVSDVESNYTIMEKTFFQSENDLFGDSSQIFELDPQASIIVPKNITFDDISSKLVYNEEDPSSVATIYYSFHGKDLGTCNLQLAGMEKYHFSFGENTSFSKEEKDKPVFIYVNTIIKIIGSLLGILILFLLIRRLLYNFHFAEKMEFRRKRRSAKKRRR